MLRYTALRTARIASQRSVAPAQARLASTQVKPTYTAQSSSTGSRAAGVSEAGGGLSVKMGMPKEMGGKEGPAGGLHNPEELYVYSTCFLSALGATHGRLHEGLKPLPKSTKVDALVSIGKDATDAVPGFHLAVELKVHKGPLTQAGLNEEQIQKLVEEAHKLCPYSRAIKGNVEVKLSLAASLSNSHKNLPQHLWETPTPLSLKTLGALHSLRLSACSTSHKAHSPPARRSAPCPPTIRELSELAPTTSRQRHSSLFHRRHTSAPPEEPRVPLPTRTSSDYVPSRVSGNTFTPETTSPNSPSPPTPTIQPPTTAEGCKRSRGIAFHLPHPHLPHPHLSHPQFANVVRRSFSASVAPSRSSLPSSSIPSSAAPRPSFPSSSPPPSPSLLPHHPRKLHRAARTSLVRSSSHDDLASAPIFLKGLGSAEKVARVLGTTVVVPLGDETRGDRRSGSNPSIGSDDDVDDDDEEVGEELLEIKKGSLHDEPVGEDQGRLSEGWAWRGRDRRFPAEADFASLSDDNSPDQLSLPSQPSAASEPDPFPLTNPAPLDKFMMSDGCLAAPLPDDSPLSDDTPLSDDSPSTASFDIQLARHMPSSPPPDAPSRLPRPPPPAAARSRSRASSPSHHSLSRATSPRAPKPSSALILRRRPLVPIRYAPRPSYKRLPRGRAHASFAMPAPYLFLFDKLEPASSDCAPQHSLEQSSPQPAPESSRRLFASQDLPPPCSATASGTGAPMVLERVESPLLDYGGSEVDFCMDDCAAVDQQGQLLPRPATGQGKARNYSVEPAKASAADYDCDEAEQEQLGATTKDQEEGQMQERLLDLKNREKALRLDVQQRFGESSWHENYAPSMQAEMGRQSPEGFWYSSAESRASEVRSTFRSRTDSAQHPPPTFDPPPPSPSSSFLRRHGSALFVYRFPIPVSSLKRVLIGRNGKVQKSVSSRSGILHLTYSEGAEGKPYGFIKGTKATIPRALELIGSEVRSSARQLSAYERQQIGECEWLRFEEEKCEPFDQAKLEHRGYESRDWLADKRAPYGEGGARWTSGRSRDRSPRRPHPATPGVHRLQPSQPGVWPERRDADDEPWDPVAGPSKSGVATVEHGSRRRYITIPLIAVRSFFNPGSSLPHLERISASKLSLEWDTSGARIVVSGSGGGGEGGVSEKLKRAIEDVVRVERGFGWWRVGDGEGAGKASFSV
ncbi:hypothetical protein JCM5296_002518 [Sporobolomyces johnsonii]